MGDQDRRVADGESSLQAKVHLIGKLHQENVPVPRIGVAAAELDFGNGKIKIMARTRALMETLTGIGEGSVVEIKGDLRARRWTTGGGSPRESFEVESESVEVLHDARRERMLG